MKTIYNTYVIMESQEQCDRMKQLCIDNGLPIWEDSIAFLFSTKENVFEFLNGEFYVTSNNSIGKDTNVNFEITEQEFIELLKTTK